MKNRIKIHKITAWITAILIIFTALSIIACAFAICKSDADKPFSKEIISRYFKYVIIQSVATIEIIIFGFALKFAFPLKEEKLRAKSNIITMRKNLTEKLRKRDAILLRTDETIRYEIALRKKLKTALTSIIFVFAITTVLFAVLIDRSVENVSLYVIRVFAFSSLFALISGILLYALDILIKKSYKREIDSIKRLLMIANTDVMENKTSAKPNHKLICINIARAVIITVAVMLLAVGILNGGAADIFEKASHICTECIGF